MKDFIKFYLRHNFLLEKKMRKNSNWLEDYLSHDGLHLNKEGVKFMAEKITFFV